MPMPNDGSHSTFWSNAISVPGSRQTATFGSPIAANPRVMELGNLVTTAHWRHGRSFKKSLPAAEQERAELAHTRRRCLASQVVCGEEGPLSALRSGRGGALAEQFGSVTRRFPWSVIAIEALPLMVFIHTCRIIIMPGHQYLLGFLAPLFESHRRLLSYVCVAAGRDSVVSRRASDYALFF